MNKLPFLPIYTDDFLQDTAHLDGLESGVYAILLMVAWRNKARLPDDDVSLARWARVDPRTWRRLKPKIMPFWTLCDGFWTQARLSKEYEQASKRAEVARENGMHGGRPKQLKNNDEVNPVGLPQEPNGKAHYNRQSKEEDSSLRSLSDATTNFEPESAKPRRASPRKPADTEHPRFPEFWDAYPKREGRKPASAKFSAAVARGIDPDLIIDGAKRYAAAKAWTDPQYIKQAEVWLNQERWNDEHANPAGRQPGRGPHRADASPDAEPFSRNVRVAALAEFRQERLARERQAPEPEIPDFFGGNEQDKPSGRLSEPRVVSGFDSFRDRTGAIFDAEVGWTHSVRS